MPRKWSLKYKRNINCSRPRGFSQKQYCKYGRGSRKPSRKKTKRRVKSRRYSRSKKRSKPKKMSRRKPSRKKSRRKPSRKKSRRKSKSRRKPSRKKSRMKPSRKKSRMKSKSRKSKKYKKASRMIDIKPYNSNEWTTIPLYLRFYITPEQKQYLVRLLRVVYPRYENNPDECEHWFSPRSVEGAIGSEKDFFIALVDNYEVIYAIAWMSSNISINNPIQKSVYLNLFCSLWPRYNDGRNEYIEQIIDPYNRGITRRTPILPYGRKTPLGRTLVIRMLEELQQYNVHSVLGHAITEAEDFWYSIPNVERIQENVYLSNPLEYQIFGYNRPVYAGDADVNMRFTLM